MTLDPSGDPGSGSAMRAGRAGQRLHLRMGSPPARFSGNRVDDQAAWMVARALVHTGGSLILGEMRTSLKSGDVRILALFEGRGS